MSKFKLIFHIASQTAAVLAQTQGLPPKVAGAVAGIQGILTIVALFTKVDNGQGK